MSVSSMWYFFRFCFLEMNSWSVPQKYPEGQKPRNPQFVLGQNWKQILREPHETNAFKKGLI